MDKYKNIKRIIYSILFGITFTTMFIGGFLFIYPTISNHPNISNLELTKLLFSKISSKNLVDSYLIGTLWIGVMAYSMMTLIYLKNINKF
ncbi:MAG: hypothetical protein ABIP51_05960 [Bacteroidia bacterium]